MNKPAPLEDDSAPPSKDRNFVTALDRGLELLRAFGTGEEYLGNAELSSRTGIPRPTVSRLTYTLTQLGYLRHNIRLEKYRLGPGILALGYRFLASQGIREIARPFMQQFGEATDCNVSLGAGISFALAQCCRLLPVTSASPAQERIILTISTQSVRAGARHLSMTPQAVRMVET